MEFQNFARKIRTTFKQGAVMILYYLWIALVLVTGEVPVTIAKPYVTEQACIDAGNATAAEMDADSDVQEYQLECHAVTFDAKRKDDSAREKDNGFLEATLALDTSAL